MTRLRVVLVEPQMPANLGFIARCLGNYALTDWSSVNGCAVEGTEAERTGARAREVLAAMQRASSLQEALADADVVIGLTARDGFRRAPTPLPELREHLHRQLGELEDSTRVALVFGREDRGLESKECELCSHLAVIPTSGRSSLNLSHAVAVTLYEWFRGRVQQPVLEQPPQPQEFRWATAAEKAQLAERTLSNLEASQFRHHHDQLHGALRRILSQPMEGRDLRQLNRIVRHVEWLREKQ